ncbi:MAG: hydrogenase maturation protease [Acidobacteria bacterium]|nr:hydrogenase maturation protease [Acidobacteriota bacterium]
MNVLVIGYGNELRGDDAVGRHIADAVSEWGLPGVRCLSARQLLPEFTGIIASAELVIFVDARFSPDGEPVLLEPVELATSVHALGHTGDPASLLSLTQAIHGHHPPAWLISVRAHDAGMGNPLSPKTSMAAEEALARIAGLIGMTRKAGVSGL